MIDGSENDTAEVSPGDSGVKTRWPVSVASSLLGLDREEASGTLLLNFGSSGFSVFFVSYCDHKVDLRGQHGDCLWLEQPCVF